MPGDWTGGAAGFAFPVAFATALVWRAWGLFASPPSDLTRIKRDLEGAGRRVTSIRRQGAELGGRNRPSYRLYGVTVQDDVRGVEHFDVGVEVTYFGDPDLKTFRRP